MTARLRAGVWIGLMLAASCGEAGDQRTETLDPIAARERRERLAGATASLLDSGSAAFSARDYAGALRHYRAAVDQDSTVAAAWFGVYMAQTALGDERAAEEAFERARELEPKASLLDPSVGGVPR